MLSCSSDYLLFGDSVDSGAWAETAEKIKNLDVKYQSAADKVLQGLIEAITEKEKQNIE